MKLNEFDLYYMSKPEWFEAYIQGRLRGEKEIISRLPDKEAIEKVLPAEVHGRRIRKLIAEKVNNLIKQVIGEF